MPQNRSQRRVRFRLISQRNIHEVNLRSPFFSPAFLFGVLTAERVFGPVLEAVNEHYLIEAEYDKEQAFAGNKNLKLKVTMKTAVQCGGASR